MQGQLKQLCLYSMFTGYDTVMGTNDYDLIYIRFSQLSTEAPPAWLGRLACYRSAMATDSLTCTDVAAVNTVTLAAGI